MMDSFNQVSLLAAFSAGFLSFISPCVLPLVPSYLSYITGLTVEELANAAERKRFRKVIIVNSLLFIAGFSSVFIAFGASASLLGQLLYEYQDVIRVIGGVLILGFGVFMFLSGLISCAAPFLFENKNFYQRRLIGVGSVLFGGYLYSAAPSYLLQMGGLGCMGLVILFLKTVCWLLILFGVFLTFSKMIMFLLADRRVFQFDSRPVGYIGSFFIGTAFAAGWTPCVGPILGGILAYASTTDSISQGITLLASYSAGLGLPFFLTAFAVNVFLSSLTKVRTYLGGVSFIGGCLLFLVGITVINDGLTSITSCMERNGVGWYLGQ